MSRESAATKARRYLAEARLTVEAVERNRVRAVCRGDGTVYDVSWTPAGSWACSCPAPSLSCAHLLALRLVTVRESPAGGAPE